jgi:hypothetical protein
MKFISQRQKMLADLTAESCVASEQSLRLFKLFSQLLDASVSDASSPSPRHNRVVVPDAPRRIGIWEPKLSGTEYCFVRAPEPAEPATLWANLRVIAPKGQRKRVVLVGESVARGFFFDPHFNSSKVLEHLLRETSGDRELEVIDLARTNLLLDPLQQLTAAAVHLRPDVVVVLAGNNWEPMSDLTPLEFQELAATVRAGGWADVKRHLENVLSQRVRLAMDTFVQIAQKGRFTLVFALPEFNLADWCTDASDPPLLTPPAMAQWHSWRTAAEAALVAGALKDAETLGLQIVGLDQGTTAVGRNIIAESKRRMGLLAEARRHLESARDSAICWPRGPESPRCYSVIQQTIRKEAAKHQFALVDLPRVFQDHWQSGLPDRRMFMDYCHFTVEGTNIAMAAVAQVVLASLFKVRRSIRDIGRMQLPVDRKIEGEAHFLAAIHNGNWEQPADIVRYHCRRAIELSPAVTRMMSLFLDFHIRRVPTSLCKSFDELCQLQNPSVISLLFDPALPKGEKFLNQRLIEQVERAIHDPDSALEPQANSLLAQEHAVDELDTDLLSKAYSTTSYYVTPGNTDHAYYRANHGRSVFSIVCKTPLVLQFDLTYRTRHSGGGQPVTVSVNGSEIAKLPASRSWTTAAPAAPAELLRSGFNSVEIDWPTPEWDLLAWKEQLADGLEAARVGGLAPICGEIHSFRASRRFNHEL